ncbi:hypothetical protein NLI96_g8589 [Meripilus lineatus]|uniref:BAG domain-containing protein n=1 Tax=Meripilus lineatus TaxID=2056292 RepID=A0AAD5V289_9APHY|nr:hypothetical protein NLI96_g8589 [Physisporinus lineatus]
MGQGKVRHSLLEPITLLTSLWFRPSPHFLPYVNSPLSHQSIPLAQSNYFLPRYLYHDHYHLRLYFPLPPQDTHLSVIRNQLAEYTQLPPASFKLIHAGAIMKDDNAPISAYGIKEHSLIAIIGGSTTAPSPPSGGKSKADSSSAATTKGKGKGNAPPIQQRPTEESTISQIRTELEKVRQKLKPDVDTFLENLKATVQEAEGTGTGADGDGDTDAQPSTTTTSPSTSPANKPKSKSKSKKSRPQQRQQQQQQQDSASSPLSSQNPPQYTNLAQEHIRLGELLLQSLLRLDAIHAEGEWEEARKERKGAVREVQGILDEVDGAWRARPKA